MAAQKISLNSNGTLSTYPMLVGDGSGPRWHVGDQIAVFSAGERPRYLPTNKHFGTPGTFIATGLKPGEILAIHGEANILTDERRAPEPIWAVVQEADGASVTIETVDGPQLAVERSNEITGRPNELSGIGGMPRLEAAVTKALPASQEASL